MFKTASNTRSPKKLEKPKPLKIARLSAPDVPSKLSNSAIDELMDLLNKVTSAVKAADFQEINSLSPVILSKLKAYGPQLEECYKDQLNQIFSSIRDVAMQENTGPVGRSNFLCMVEMRASGWQSNSDIIHQFSRLGLTEGDSQDSSAASAPQPAPILSPGEVLKASGKFSSPTKMPGKSYCKDEVVIRNADSGKVNPGAKERLVQITGPSEAKVDLAKQLMEETIRRNASPVREDGKDLGGSNSSLNSSTSEDSEKNKLPFQSVEFKHSVTSEVGKVVLSSLNLDLVRKAKIILDEHLPRLDHAQDAEPPAREEPVLAPTPPLKKEEPPSPPMLEAHPSQDDNPPLAHQVRVVYRETKPKLKPLVRVGDPDLTVPLVPVKPSCQYSRAFLLDCSASHICSQAPHNFEKISDEFPRIIKQGGRSFDAAAFNHRLVIREQRSKISDSD